MFKTIRLTVAMMVFLVIYAFVIAPALQDFIGSIKPFTGGAIGGVIGSTQTALFLGMPLLLLGGTLVLLFLVASGLRGSSRTR
jgi:hypothetical protein